MFYVEVKLIKITLHSNRCNCLLYRIILCGRWFLGARHPGAGSLRLFTLTVLEDGRFPALFHQPFKRSGVPVLTHAVLVLTNYSKGKKASSCYMYATSVENGFLMRNRIYECC